MRTYKEICEEVGYDNTARSPSRVTKYFAYKNGEVVLEATDYESARAVSKVVETVVVNQKEIDVFKQEQRARAKVVADRWDSELRTEFSELSDKQFELLKGTAYENYSGDQDALYDEMVDLLGFYQEMKKWATSNNN